MEDELFKPVIADPGLEDEVEGWENEGGAVLHEDGFEPTAEGDDGEEG